MNDRPTIWLYNKNKKKYSETKFPEHTMEGLRKETIEDDNYAETDIDFNLSSFSNAVLWQAPFALDIKPLTPSGGLVKDINIPGGTSRKYGNNNAHGDNTSLKLGERGIINPIWQYNEDADPRTNGVAGYNYGRVYHQRIRVNNPVVFIQPGRPKFFGTVSFLDGGTGVKDNKLREAILGDLGEKDSLQDSSVIPSITDFLTELSEDGMDTDGSGAMKFYDFQPDFFRYRAYARSLCEEFMMRLGILNTYKNPDTPFGWGITDPFTQFMDYYDILDGSVANAPGGKYQSGFLPFRVEKTTESSESFNNEIGASSFASQIKGQAENVKELLFLTGGGKGAATNSKDIITNLVGAITETVIGGVAGIGSEPASAIIRTGGNIIFPEIWKDSTYSKTLTIQMKFHSPSAHPLAMFENIYFPLACVMPLAFPRQVSAAVYISPPLVRLYSKGWFSCDMGMVDSITIKRGTNINEWTSNNMPRTIDVTLSIKDLFSNMMLSIGGSAKKDIKIFSNKNSLLRDYLNVLCGIDAFAAAKLSTRAKNWLNLRVSHARRLLDPINWISGIQGMAATINVSKIINAFWQ